MKLHWSPFSPFVRKVLVVAHELGLSDRLQIVRTQVAATQPNPELMVENPLSKIPSLLLGNGLAIYDSRVICEYLDGLSGKPKLFPVNHEDRITALRRQALADGLVDFLVAWRGEMSRPPDHRLPDYLSNYPVRLRATLLALEKEAADIDESAYSIGHIAIGCALSYLDLRFASENWREGHGRLAAWHETLLLRSAFKLTEVSNDASISRPAG